MLIDVHLPSETAYRLYARLNWRKLRPELCTSPALDWLLTLLLLQSVDIPGLGFGQSEYFPYVYYKINVDMLDTKM